MSTFLSKEQLFNLTKDEAFMYFINLLIDNIGVSTQTYNKLTAYQDEIMAKHPFNDYRKQELRKIKENGLFSELKEKYGAINAVILFFSFYNIAWKQYKTTTVVKSEYIHSCEIPDEFYTNFDWDEKNNILQNNNKIRTEFKHKMEQYNELPFYKKFFKHKPVRNKTTCLS